MEAIRLGVNLDHVATLRQVRKTSYPSLLRAAEIVLDAGASQITVHLREDRRHIQEEDVWKLRRFLRRKKKLLNLEMAWTKEMIAFALEVRPDWVCVVPEKRKELTTEGGLHVFRLKKKLQEALPLFKKRGIRVSLFIEPDEKTVQESAQLGVEAIELHTGHYALLKGREQKKALRRLYQAALFAWDKGLSVHAGHGLHQENLRPLALLKREDGQPAIVEFNIGHALVCDALFDGLWTTTRKYLSLLRAP